MKPIVTVMKQNFRSNWLSLLLTAVVVLAATTANDAAMAISRGNYTWLLIILLPFFVVFFNFPKLMYLNTSKKAYLLGSLLTYTVAAAFVSLINTFIHLLIDPINRSQTVVNLMELCGWWKNGVLTAFLQQFLFLLLAAIFFACSAVHAVKLVRVARRSPHRRDSLRLCSHRAVASSANRIF